MTQVSPSPAIEAIDLARTYRTHTGVVRRRPISVEAVRGISFEARCLERSARQNATLDVR